MVSIQNITEVVFVLFVDGKIFRFLCRFYLDDYPRFPVFCCLGEIEVIDQPFLEVLPASGIIQSQISAPLQELVVTRGFDVVDKCPAKK